jgi:hypothetical protein
MTNLPGIDPDTAVEVTVSKAILTISAVTFAPSLAKPARRRVKVTGALAAIGDLEVEEPRSRLCAICGRANLA